MNNVSNAKIEKVVKKVLLPMMNILDSKNIYTGINYTYNANQLFISFDRRCLSNTNQLIIEKISSVYSENFFYSNNKDNPNSDILEYWCPEKEYDEKYHITERIRNKRFAILKLDLDDIFTILGTTIILANSLQEQDPIQLKINEDCEILSPEILSRHQHYVDSNCPDEKWINLTVILNKDNPLTQNDFAPLISQIELNSPISCDNIVVKTIMGLNQKKYVIFNMEREELEKAIKWYYENIFYPDGDVKKEKIQEIQKKLLK